MSINKQLDTLFDKWEKEPCFNDGNFFRDGIINEERYNNQKMRILFIAKEPNMSNHVRKTMDFRVQWNEGMPNYRLANQIATLSHGILNNFPIYDSIKPGIEDLKSIAFMNIKKSAGGSVSNYKDFKQYLDHKNNLYYIKTEIELIKPDIILLGLTWNRIRNEIFTGIKWLDSGLGVKYAKMNNSIILDYYHPSSMIPSNVDYYFLKTVLDQIL